MEEETNYHTCKNCNSTLVNISNKNVIYCFQCENITRTWITEKNNELLGNINNYSINENVIDTFLHEFTSTDANGKKTIIKIGSKNAVIKDKTSNSIYVFLPAVSEEGVDSYQYFYVKDFEKRFKKI